MGNQHSQPAAEPGAGWSRTVPRDRTAARLLSYGPAAGRQPATQVLPDRVPGQKLRISASLPGEGVVGPGARSAVDLQRSSPQGRSQSSLLRYEDQTDGVVRTHGSEPDLRGAGVQRRSRRKIVRGRVSPGRRKLRAQPPPELPVPPPPGEPPPPLPTPDQSPAGAGSSRRRLFRPHAQRRATGVCPPPAVRPVSEEPSAATDESDGGRGCARARSVDCLQAVLQQRRDDLGTEVRERTSSLPRRGVESEEPHERSRLLMQHNSQLDGSRTTSRSEEVLQGAFERREREEATQKTWRQSEEVVSEPDEMPKLHGWDGHRIKIEVATDDIQVGSGGKNKPKLVFFGMENGHSTPADQIVPEEGSVSALTKVKRNEEVRITGARVSYRRPTEHQSTRTASHESSGSGESGAAGAVHLQRIPTQKLNDFMSTLERSKRRQLSASRDEILTSSPAHSYRSQSSAFDCELQLGMESISMHLRPSLPKKQQQMPRFSPLAAWKSLHLDEAARREWREEPLTKQPLRNQLGRHRPVTQSADSGIGGDAGSPSPPSPRASAATRADATNTELPLAASTSSAGRPSCWTPAQDLEEASSGDDASLKASQDSQRALPKLTSRGGMFSGSERPRIADDPTTVGIANGTGVMGQSLGNSAGRQPQSPTSSLDQNWMLSRSVPSSLNADIDLTDALPRLDASRHVMYLPEYQSMRVERGRSISPHGRDVVAAAMWVTRGTSADRASPEKPPRSSAPSGGGRRKFAFQSTLRLIEKKRLEAQLGREAEEKERQRREEQEAMQRVESEFLQKRLQESQFVQHRLNVSQPDSSNVMEDTARVTDHPTSSDVTSSDTGSDCGFSSHKESPQSSPRSIVDTQLPAQGRGDAFWVASGPPVCPAPDYGSLPPLLDQHPVSLPPPEQPLPPPAAAARPGRLRLLSGVRNWLRGRRNGHRPSSANMARVHREEPEGAAASSPDRQLDPAWDAAGTRWGRSSNLRQPQHKSAERLASNSTEDSCGEPALYSPSDSTGQQPSSGYDSSPSLGTSRRLTQELRDRHQERRQYRDYRSPVARYRYGTRSPSIPEGFSPNRLCGRKTPSSVYSEPQSKRDSRSRLPAGVPVESQSEIRSSRPVISQGNYRRAFAWASAGHHTSPLAVAPDNSAGSERSRAARLGRAAAGFQRSLSYHELQFRGRPASRGHSEERLDTGPPPQHRQLRRRGYVPRYINNSPARYIHSGEPRLLHTGRRPLTLLPPRPASAFPA